eukprot:scaffold87513_cov45-Phaeocystis_antarctica.AAC.2
MVPVMLMGYLVSGKRYTALECAAVAVVVVLVVVVVVVVVVVAVAVVVKTGSPCTYGMAVAITSGAAIFKLNEDADPNKDEG